MSKFKKTGIILGASGILTVGVLLFVIGVLISVSLLFNDNSKEVNAQTLKTEIQTEKATVIPTEEPTEEPTIEPISTAEPIVDRQTKKVTTSAAVKILEEAYKGMAIIKYDVGMDVISITPLDNNFTLGVLYAKDGDSECLKNWDTIKGNLVEISKLMDDNIVITIVNNMNTENTLLMVSNGVVLYNAAED